LGARFQVLNPRKDIDFWQEEETQKQLVYFLNFLSNDEYSFSFTKLTVDREKQQYLDIRGPHWDFQGVERVIMFSGGLDFSCGSC
jgi:hypothetical protein